jgi:cullin-4
MSFTGGVKAKAPAGAARKLVIKPLKRESTKESPPPPPLDAPGARAERARARGVAFLAPSSSSSRPNAPNPPPRTARHTPTTVKPQLPPDFEEATWRELSEAVAAVFEKRPIASAAPPAAAAAAADGRGGGDGGAPPPPPPPPTLQALYRGVEDLCAHHAEERLYKRLMAQLDAHLARELERLDGHAAALPSGCGGGGAAEAAAASAAATAATDALTAFLEKVDAFWRDHCAQMLLVRAIFLHLDRTYVVQRLPGMRSLVDASLAALRARLALAPRVRDRAVDGLLALVARERAAGLEGGGRLGGGGGAAAAAAAASDRRALCASLCRMLAELGLHAEALRPALLEATRAHYRAEGERLCASLPAPAYLAHCDARLAQEAERCVSCLDAGTLGTSSPQGAGAAAAAAAGGAAGGAAGAAGAAAADAASAAAAAAGGGGGGGCRAAVVAVVERELVSRHVGPLLERGLPAMLDAGASADVARLRRLCARVGATEALRAAWREYGRARAHAVVHGTPGCAPEQAAEEEREMVPRLLELKGRLDRVLSEALQGRPLGVPGAGGAAARGGAADAAAAADALGVPLGCTPAGMLFAHALKDALESAVNSRPSKPAELVAKYMDARLRGVQQPAPLSGAAAAAAAAAGASGGGAADGGGGGGAAAPPPLPPAAGAEEGDLEADLDRALALFRHIQGKDVFEAFYKKDLAKRLLLGRSASVDAEKGVLARLKAECGAQFTSKLEGMFRDMELSREVVAGFRQWQQQQQQQDGGGGGGGAGAAAAAAASRPASGDGAAAPPVEVSVAVLTSGFWPTYPPLDLVLPEELERLQSAFAEHYLSKHSGRRLAWQHALATCVVRARFPKGAKELSVSLQQAAVLCLFNDVQEGAGGGGGGELTYEEIRARVLPAFAAGGGGGAAAAAAAPSSSSSASAAAAADDRELRRTLQSLACGRVRVLRKLPAGRDVADADAFSFNADFSERLFRIRVNAIQARETPEEHAKTSEAVAQDRQHQVDAAVVRVMKSRRRLSHRLLVAEVLGQLQAFPLSGAELKRRIESLIEREYLARDPSDATMYNYLA